MSSWIILHALQLRLKYQVESLSSKPMTCSVQVLVGVSWLKSTKQQKKITKTIISRSAVRVKDFLRQAQKELASGKPEGSTRGEKEESKRKLKRSSQQESQKVPWEGRRKKIKEKNGRRNLLIQFKGIEHFRRSMLQLTIQVKTAGCFCPAARINQLKS